eukprot:7742-Heterococcus_DN1.PRE.1
MVHTTHHTSHKRTYCRSDRNGKPESLILDGEEECEPFWELLGGKGPVKPAVDDTVPLPTACGTKRCNCKEHSHCCAACRFVPGQRT